MAALLHDLGKAFLPPALLKKSKSFTESERKQLLRHPILGVQAMLRMGQYSEGLLKRIMVVCEHHEGVQGAAHHFYSRVVAVAETFDALTTERPHRPAFLPDAAVKMLIDMAGKRLDRDIVRLFVRTLGLFPCGTCVELNTGELAIVFHPSPDPKYWMLPIVRIVRDKDGLGYRVPRQVDLTEVPKGASEPPRHIVRTLDPASIGLNVAGCLYADTSKDER
jgi:HD-GYP domain-containing protein (c-di-GMP phosphodiesterase class II)